MGTGKFDDVEEECEWFAVLFEMYGEGGVSAVVGRRPTVCRKVKGPGMLL